MDTTYRNIKTFPLNPIPSDVNKEWFVYFDQWNETKWIHRRVKGDINRLHNFREKKSALADLLKAVCSKLEQSCQPIDLTGDISLMPLSAAMDYGLKECRVSDATMKGYRHAVKCFKEAAEKLSYSSVPVSKIRRKHARLVLKQCQEDFTWSNHNYNKQLGYLKAVFSRLEEFEIIEYNPLHKIKTLEVEETQKYIPYTDQERARIREHLYLHHYRFFSFLMVIYQTGIRPMEVLALKVKDFSIDARVITIQPSQKRKNSKTKKRRVVAVNDHLFPFLREQVNGSDPEYYIFGSPYESGKGNRGTGTRHPEYFKSSFTRIKRDTVTKLWKKVVMDGLGIPKHLYAAKHTGANAKILAGVSLRALQEMYGHASSLMTEKYITVLQGIHRKEINEKSPEF